MTSIKSVLIVESPNDAAFIRLLLSEEGIGPEMDTIALENLDRFEDPEGKTRWGKPAIESKLHNIKRDLHGKYAEVNKVGIILDMDEETLSENLERINDAATVAFGTEVKITDEAKKVIINMEISRFEQTKNIELSCFFTKDSTKKGNLDSLLFELRSNTPVPYADCLADWRRCVEKSEPAIRIKDKDYLKMWIDFYLRGRALQLGNKKQSDNILKDFQKRKTEIIQNFGATAFNLSHPAVKDLRNYLSEFKDVQEDPQP